MVDVVSDAVPSLGVCQRVAKSQITTNHPQRRRRQAAVLAYHYDGRPLERRGALR